MTAHNAAPLPGFIDTHTHFEMNKGTPRETADGWASGTRAAMAGGTTTVLDFAEPERGASLASALEVCASSPRLSPGGRPGPISAIRSPATRRSARTGP